MHLFVTEMCTRAHFCYKMVHCGIWESALCDLWIRSIGGLYAISSCLWYHLMIGHAVIKCVTGYISSKSSQKTSRSSSIRARYGVRRLMWVYTLPQPLIILTYEICMMYEIWNIIHIRLRYMGTQQYYGHYHITFFFFFFFLLSYNWIIQHTGIHTHCHCNRKDVLILCYSTTS